MFTLLLAAVTTFGGGTTNDLVQAIRKGTNQDVVIVRGVTVAGKLEAFDFDPESMDLLNTAVHAKTALKIVPGSEPLFSDELIPPTLLGGFSQVATTGRQGRFNPQNPNGGPIPDPVVSTSTGPSTKRPLSANDIVSGKVTFKTEKVEFLDVSSLLSAPLGKPVQLSWVYMDMQPAVDFRGTAPSLFLQKVAKGIGAKYRETDQGYFLDLSPEEFRRRALKSLNAMKIATSSPQAAVTTAKLQLAIAAMQSLPSNSLIEAFATPGSKTMYTMARGSSLLAPANSYLQAMMRAPAQGGRGGGGNSRQLAQTLRMVDNRRNPVLIFDAHFQSQIDIPIMDAQGRPNGTVRF